MASLIVWTIMFAVFGLFISYFLIELYNKRQIKKIREGYDENADKSRPGSIAGNTGRCREKVIRSDAGEGDITTDVNTITTSTDQPDTSDDIGTDEGEEVDEQK